MEPVSSTIILSGLLGFGKECISDHLKETAIRHVALLPKKILKALQDVDAPVNNHVEKAAYAAQWLATKLFVQQLKPQHHNLAIEPFERIEAVADKSLKQIEDNKYVPPSAPLGNDNIITLASDETFRDWDHQQLGRQLRNAHLEEIKQRLPKGLWHNRTAFEQFEESLEIGCRIYSKAGEERTVQWFELVCAFFNELLKGDNNKAKDSYQNQLLAKISLQNQELKEYFIQVSNQFDQHFVADRIGTTLFEEIKTLVHEELRIISNTLNRVEDKVDKTYEKVTQIDTRLGSIQDVLSKPIDSEIKFLTPIPPIDATRLIGRVNDIQRVLDKLEAPNAQVLIRAMKGTGKTSLAKAITKVILNSKQLSHVAWISGGNDLLNALIEQVGRIQLREQVERAIETKLVPQTIVSQIVTPFLLNKSGENLLVIDNLTHDQRTLYRKVCAGLSNWKILATSYEQVGENFDVYNLQFLSVEESRDLFYSYYETGQRDDDSVDTLIRAIGYHTLTVELMAKTADVLGYAPARLLAKFMDNGLALNNTPLDLDSDHSTDPVDGLLSYYEVIFDLSALNDFEKTLLLQLSILPAVQVERSFIEMMLNVNQGSDDEEQLNIALRRLANLGWLQQNGSGYLMHQVVQTIIRHKLQPTATTCKTTINSLISSLSRSVYANPTSIIYLISYTQSVLANLEYENNRSLNRLASLLGELHQMLGDYKAAEDQFQSTFDRVIALEGDEHLLSAGAYFHLGTVYMYQGKYIKALEFHEKALMIRRAKLFPFHPDIANSFNSLGLVYSLLGRYNQAIECHNKALSTSMKRLGDESADAEIAMSLNSLGITYYDMGNHTLAIEYHEKALEIKRRYLGEDHPYTAGSYNNLALAYTDKGNYAKALEYHKLALEINRSRLGEDHPDTGGNYQNLAGVYVEQGDYAKAIEYHEQALSIRSKSLGEGHPSLAKNYISFGIVFCRQGNYAKAIEYQQKALNITQGQLGDYHPDVAIPYHNLGVIHHNLGDYKKSLEYHEKQLDIKLRELGADHIDIAHIYKMIGRAYDKLGCYPNSIEYFKKALLLQDSKTKEDHSTIAASCNDLGLVLVKNGSYQEAIHYYKKSLDIRQSWIKADYSAIAGVYNNLGLAYVKQGNHSDAISCYKTALTIVQDNLGDGHLDTFIIFINLGEAYREQGDHINAIDHYRRAIEVSDNQQGKDHSDTGVIYCYMGLICHEQGSHDRAVEFHKKAISIIRNQSEENHLDLISCYNCLGVIYSMHGDYIKAIDSFKNSLDISNNILGKDHPDTASVYNNLGIAHRSQGDYDKAIECHQKALSIIQDQLGDDHYDTAISYYSLGTVYYCKDDYVKAVKCILAALDIGRSKLGEVHPDIVMYYGTLGSVYTAQGDYAQAIESEEKALKISCNLQAAPPP